MPTILVVDDMPIFREPIEVVLRAEGFKTVTASNGHEAIAALSSTKPDLVLLDLGMPVMDGLEFLKHLRRGNSRSAIPVIVLSAESDRVRIVEAVSLGISGYLLKSGFSLATMLEKVRAVLSAGNHGQPPGSLEAPAGLPAHSSPTGKSPLSSPVPKSPTVGPSTAPSEATKSSTQSSTSNRSLDHRGETSASQSCSPSVRIAGNEAPTTGIPQDVRDLRPILTRSELLERLKSCQELKGFSPAVGEILRLTKGDGASLDEVGKAIAQDQSLSLRILKLANSSLYAHGDRVFTVQKAVQRIGIASIRQAAMNIGVVERFSSPIFKDHISTPQFWEHSIACGVIAADLARAAGDQDADLAFTCGLLHDMGRIILADLLGEQYLGVIDTARRLNAPLETVESRMLLLNHAEVMARVLSAWKLPGQLADPIMHHHVAAADARNLSPLKFKQILRLGLADRLAHALLIGNSGNEIVYPIDDHCQALGVTPDLLRGIEMSAPEKTEEARFALMASSAVGEWPQRADEWRARLPRPIRPVFGSASPECDSFRVLLDTVAGKRSSEPPNIAVAHLASPKAGDMAALQILTEEKNAQTGALPLCIVAPNKSWPIPDALLAGRSVNQLRSPISLHELFDALGTALTEDRTKLAA